MTGKVRRFGRFSKPNCINTKLAPHVRWMGKCLNQALEGGRTAGFGGRYGDRWQFGPAVACGRVRAVQDQRGPLNPAAVDGMRSAQMQMAAGGWIDRAWNVALQDGALTPRARTRDRDR